MPSSSPSPRAERVSLLQHSALFRLGLAAIVLTGLWLAIVWAIALP